MFPPALPQGNQTKNGHLIQVLSELMLRLVMAQDHDPQHQLSPAEASLLSTLLLGSSVPFSSQTPPFLNNATAILPSTFASIQGNQAPPQQSFTHPRDELVRVMSRIYKRNLTTSSGGNCSVKDSNGVVWVTPKGNDKGALQRDEIAYCENVTSTFKQWQGKFPPSSEWPFHTAIFERRSDVGAVLHAHSHTLVAFSVANELPDSYSLSQTATLCGSVALAPYALPGTDALADSIVSQIQYSDCIVMENHGIVVVAPTMTEAYHKFEALEFCARAELGAITLGGRKLMLSSHDLEAQKRSVRWPVDMSSFPALRPPVTPSECDLRAALVKYIRRCYDQGLIHATSGAMSARLDSNRFLITATGIDRHFVTPQDIVLVDVSVNNSASPPRYFAEQPNSRKPSRAWAVHAAIYQAFPDIQAVMHAHPIHITSFCLSSTEFTPNVIPESFIVLRDVGRLSFRESFDPNQVVQRFKERSDTCNILLGENDGVIIKGSSLEQVFDRLEVLEATANVVLEAKTIGRVNVMTLEQEDEVHEQFFGTKLDRHIAKKQRVSDGNRFNAYQSPSRITVPTLVHKSADRSRSTVAQRVHREAAQKRNNGNQTRPRTCGPLIQHKAFTFSSSKPRPSPKPIQIPPPESAPAYESPRVTGPFIQHKKFPSRTNQIRSPPDDAVNANQSPRVTGPLIQYKKFQTIHSTTTPKANATSPRPRVRGPLMQHKTFARPQQSSPPPARTRSPQPPPTTTTANGTTPKAVQTQSPPIQRTRISGPFIQHKKTG